MKACERGERAKDMIGSCHVVRCLSAEVEFTFNLGVISKYQLVQSLIIKNYIFFYQFLKLFKVVIEYYKKIASLFGVL